MSSKSQILLDFGGTHTKSQTWIDGVLISQEICRSPQSSRGLRGEVTIDPREFSEHAIQMFNIAKESATSNCELAVSSQMACFLLLGVDGRPASEIVSWQDERSLYLSLIHI